LASSVIHEIDFEKDGRQAGCLRLPFSRNKAGWGTVEIPICVVKNGSGPTLLLTGGVHGDEYEGQIALSRLARTLDPARVQGRVIIMPAVDLPAALAMTRLCPLDDRDLNRVFPGNPRGTFTEKLAHFIDSEILPLVDVSVDIHTGGSSMDSAMSTNMHFLEDEAHMNRSLEAAAAFGAPYNVVFWGVDEGATLTSSVERRGLLSLGTEVGGYARVSVEGVAVAERGADNIMKHLGLIEGDPLPFRAEGTRHMGVKGPDHFTFAPADGLFEPKHRPGEQVEAGEVAGIIHFIEDFGREPVELRYLKSGILWMTQGPGRPQKGDAVAVVMAPLEL